MSSSDLLHEARRALGIDQLVLAIHDSMFPSATGEDIGRGSPYSRGADDLVAFVRELGFTGVQLGPQGETTRGNRSPYDGTVFAKSVLSIDLPTLAASDAWAPLFATAAVQSIFARRPEGENRVHYAYAFDAMRSAVRDAWTRFNAGGSPALRARFAAFRAANAAWLDHDEAFERATGQLELGEAFAFGQFVVHAQHEAHAAHLRAGARPEWTTYGDLQVGLSMCDRFGRDALFLPTYAMGAPPSRTEPDGQPWGYPVLDPRSPEAVQLVRLRVEKMLREMDGLRIDHPHGLVCPWVYDTTDPDPFHAVKNGARLFESPDLPDHPALAAWSIVRPDQIDRTVTRYADGWVRELDEAQVTAFGSRFDDVMAALSASGRDARAVLCEVLSTQPLPLGRVLDRHHLGRFRVTQKGNPSDVRDGYRSENARPADWIMVGNHDTPPLLQVVDKWIATGAVDARARYLGQRLAVDPAWLAAEPGRLTQAMFADLFASPARNVMVFVTDFLGIRAVYNRPGIVDDVNWTWRVPNDFRAVHHTNATRGDALDVRRAMAMALRAKSDATRARSDLIAALERAD